MCTFSEDPIPPAPHALQWISVPGSASDGGRSGTGYAISTCGMASPPLTAWWWGGGGRSGQRAPCSASEAALRTSARPRPLPCVTRNRRRRSCTRRGPRSDPPLARRYRRQSRANRRATLFTPRLVTAGIHHTPRNAPRTGSREGRREGESEGLAVRPGGGEEAAELVGTERVWHLLTLLRTSALRASAGNRVANRTRARQVVVSTDKHPRAVLPVVTPGGAGCAHQSDRVRGQQRRRVGRRPVHRAPRVRTRRPRLQAHAPRGGQFTQHARVGRIHPHDLFTALTVKRRHIS